MPTVKLDQRRVDALKPRKSAYNVRDRDLKGFGLRVWPYISFTSTSNLAPRASSNSNGTFGTKL